MPPLVDGWPEDPLAGVALGRESSPESSSPSFQLVSPPLHGHGGRTDDTSYDTSVASVPKGHDASHALETDIESESDTERPAHTSLAARMQKKATAPRAAPLFLWSDDEDEAPTDARQTRMERLRALAQQRAASESSQEDGTHTVEAPPTPPHPDPTVPPVEEDSDVSEDLAALSPPPTRARARGLSKKEERDMHSMTARLRREHRTSLPAMEPKRYQLSELLSTIQYAAAPSPGPSAMYSSDPVEMSSTPEAHAVAPRRASPLPTSDAHAQKKWAWLEAQGRSAQDSDEDEDDLEVVALGPHPPPRVRFRTSPPRDVRREAADASLAHLAVHPRTPRRQRIATMEYRSPHAQAPAMPPVPDEQMSAAGHAFALAAHKIAGTLPPTSPARGDATSPPRRAPPPPIMGLDALNATLLQKVHAQNAQVHAKKQRHTPAASSSLSSPPPAPHSPPPDPAALPARAPTPSPASSVESSPHSARNSEKENVPPHELSPTTPRLGSASTPSLSDPLHDPLTELPAGDLGAFFAPTPALGDNTPAASSSVPLSRTSSSHSVLAQFFEAGTQESVRSGSLDLFANQRRSGPVGGMTQFFEATPTGTVSRSQEAMPPPTRAPSGDAFAALRRAEQADAQAPPSPDILPSVHPSEHQGETVRAPSTHGLVYLNEDGFFTQTKPVEGAWPASAHNSDSESEQGSEPASEHATLSSRPPRAHRPTSAFVFGEADESEDEAHHGGLAGVFSDREDGSDDDGDQDSDADDDLSSLLDDESDEDAEAKDDAARQRYMQHRDEDDAAMQALHERATKGLLRHRRRGKDDLLADLLDEDADEEELRRRIQAPQFRQGQRRKVDGDGLDALAAREDAQAFVRMYSETHDATDKQAAYDFLDVGEESSGDERVSAHAVRAEILRRQRHRALSPTAEMPPEDDGAARVKLRARRPSMPPKRAAQTSDDETSHYSRVLFQSGKVDVSQLPPDVQEKRARLLDEYSHEPTWQQGRGGSGNRRRAPSKRSLSAPTPRVLEPAPLAPSVLVPQVLRREAHFP
ncbi:hypothetical protein MNAN1_001412 [Malassezia nana]|uniref:DNA replication checkpoint mediator MRC1 domain-containing protein n=1 Tax=Malassezia nana TaxID=180528 RepID=A0AAF0EIH1_9BASI|nr:hypothetical protein MNAN1_001412 [Malassezia nana]